MQSLSVIIGEKAASVGMDADGRVGVLESACLCKLQVLF